MSKLRLTIEMDVNIADDMSNAELHQMLYDELIQAAIENHCEWAIRWLVNKHAEEPHREHMSKRHSVWRDTLMNSKLLKVKKV